MTLGEWAPEQPAPDATAKTVLPVDVAGLAQELLAKQVAASVKAEIQHVIGPIVAEAVAAVLTPERLDQLAADARAAAELELQGPAVAEAEEPAPPELYYGSVDEFVHEFIVPVFGRRVGERAARRWCAEWWRSAEATIRLEALWRSWEHLRLDPATGMSVWLRDHADHHLAVLWDPEGPFASSVDAAKPGDPLPYTAPPPGLFPNVRG
jgi:Domain of unknown function (DUF4913)